MKDRMGLVCERKGILVSVPGTKMAQCIMLPIFLCNLKAGRFFSLAGSQQLSEVTLLDSGGLQNGRWLHIYLNFDTQLPKILDD